MKPFFSIDEVVDRLAIYDLYARYVHYADDSDISGLDDIFEPDAVFDYSADNFGIVPWSVLRDSDIFRGRAFSKTLHLSGNLFITFLDGSSAKVFSKTIAPFLVEKEGCIGQVYQTMGGYEDLIVRREDGWKFKSRKWNSSFISSGQGVVQTMSELT